MKSFFSNISPGQYLILLFAALAFGVWSAWLAQNARVKIEWTTASELNTVGFNLYRRNSVDGAEIRVNPELIPASSEPLTGGEYQYVDRGVEPGRTYFYELEDVEADGLTNRSWETSVTVAKQGLLEGGIAIILGLFAALGMLLRAMNNRVEDAE